MVNQTYYDRRKDKNINPSDIELVLAGYVRSQGEYADAVLPFDQRGEIYHHLCKERKSCVAWYPFIDDAHILEVDGEFGAITGALCDAADTVYVTTPSLFRAKLIADRYSKRNNLTVYAGDIEDIQFDCQFDYIIIHNVVDKIGYSNISKYPYICNIMMLSKYLKHEGKLLIADENLFRVDAVRNIEGSLNPWSQIPKLDKASIESILKESGFIYHKFYYPLPNHYVTASVFSDDRLPTAQELNYFCNYQNTDLNFFVRNYSLMGKIVDNGMFPALAPAFFVEAGRTNNMSVFKQSDVIATLEYESEKGVPKGRIRKDVVEPAIRGVSQDADIIDRVIDVELDLLEKLIEVCKKHELKVYPMYGTLLGIVRHGGLIPGDDDIDVAMSRSDFDKLIVLADEFEGEYFLQTPYNDECFYGGYLKLRNRNTTSMHWQNWWTDACEGISIDIFPLDYGYIDVKKEVRKCRRICTLQRMLYAKVYGYFPEFKDMKLLKWKMFKYIGKLFSKEKLVHMLYKEMSSGDKVSSAPFGIFAHYLGFNKKPKLMDSQAFLETFSMGYENLIMDVPSGWDSLLKGFYGSDYMRIIPFQERKRRHGFYNVDVPYTVYKHRHRDLFRPMPSSECQIVLFGDGLLYKKYFDKWRDEIYKPTRIVKLYSEYLSNGVHEENPKEKVCGVEIETFEHFKCNRPSNLYPIICSCDVRRAEAMLQEIGIYDYYIYWPNRAWMLYSNWWSIVKEI